MHVVVAGGGTAGHIEPALNLADALVRIDPSITVSALGTQKGLETRLVPARGYELDLIPAVPLPRKVNKDLVTLPGRLRSAISQTREVYRQRSADVVVGFGGYVALPAYLAARRSRVPIVVHEANAVAGLANKVGARFTEYIAETTPGSLADAEEVGLPLRSSIADLDRGARRAEARAFFGLDPQRPVLFVFGGSQGARRINEAVVGAADELAAAGIGVLHSVGGKNADQRPDHHVDGYVSVDYIDRMDLAYAAADLAVCRSGAMTVAELSAVGLPAIYVPLPIGNGEQRRNADGVVDAGGGLVVDDADLTPARLVAAVVPLATDPARLLDMSAAAASQGRRGAAERLARMTLTAGGTHGRS